jgi:hypothetical protein
MRYRLKTILSILTIGLFLLFALASEFLDESTNTTVEVPDCKSDGPVSGQLYVEINYVNLENDPVPFADGTLFITHQKVNSDSCTFEVVLNLVIPFELDAQGKFIYEGPSWTHDNTGDLFRVQVSVPPNKDVFYYGFDVVEVKRFNDSRFIITQKNLSYL